MSSEEIYVSGREFMMIDLNLSSQWFVPGLTRLLSKRMVTLGQDQRTCCHTNHASLVWFRVLHCGGNFPDVKLYILKPSTSMFYIGKLV